MGHPEFVGGAPEFVAIPCPCSTDELIFDLSNRLEEIVLGVFAHG